MSARMTEGVMKWALRFYSRRFLWQQRSILATASIMNTPCQHLVEIWTPRLSHTSFSWSHVRFYSQDRNSTELEESEFLPTQPFEVQYDERPPDLTHSKSIFYKHLLKCSSPTDVLDLTVKYSPTIRQISNSINYMWFTTKKMSEEQRRYELQLMFDHPAFEGLLETARKTVHLMRFEGMAYSLLSMVRLGVPQKSLVVQTFLRSCQEKLNDFDEKSLSILASAVGQMEPSPNVNALKEGMRLIVEARLPGIKRVMGLQTMMRVVGKNAPYQLKRKLEKKALSMTDQFTLPNTQYMIITMAAIDFHSKPLLDICSKKLIENLHGIPFNRLLKLLLTCKELFYRDPDLFNSISDYVTSTVDIWTNKQLLLFLYAFEGLLYCPAPLMEIVADKVIADPNFLTFKDLFCVLKVYSSLNYDLQDRRQQFLDSLSVAVHSYLPKMSNVMLLKCVYHLCLLGHFPPAPLEQLLQSSVLDQLAGSNISKTHHKMMLMVDQCLRLDRPPLPNPLPLPSSVLGAPGPRTLTVNPLFSQGLQKVMADETQSTLEEMVLVENYFVDGVITKPQPRREANVAEEECPPAESRQKIAVICASQGSFCFGTTYIRGPLAVKIRHLKNLGYTPVLVMEPEIQSLPEEKWIETLKKRIFPEHISQECQSGKEELGL